MSTTQVSAYAVGKACSTYVRAKKVEAELAMPEYLEKLEKIDEELKSFYTFSGPKWLAWTHCPDYFFGSMLQDRKTRFEQKGPPTWVAKAEQRVKHLVNLSLVSETGMITIDEEDATLLEPYYEKEN